MFNACMACLRVCYVMEQINDHEVIALQVWLDEHKYLEEEPVV